MDKIKEISVFFPCYNEAENIALLTRKAVEVLDPLVEDYEIIIVDDGSCDSTAEVALGLAEEYDCVKVVRHNRNQGYGAALRSGFSACTKELVFYTDGDNQYDVSELRLLLPHLGKADIVSGYRQIRADPLPRKINAAIYNLALMLLFGLRIKDVDCAFKLYRRELFEKIKIESDGAVVDAEILLKARKLEYRIAQVGVNHYPRVCGKPTGARIGVIIKAMLELLRLRLRL